MKRNFFVGIIILILSLNTYAQPKWIWQNPLPQGNDLIDVFVISSQTAISVGRHGTCLKTTDSGASWTSLNFQSANPTGITEDLYSVHFVQMEKGWIVGSNNTILRTTDSGQSWIMQKTPFTFDPLNPFVFPATYHLRSVCFLDANRGWAAGFKEEFENFNISMVGAILKTTDGGNTWIDKPIGTDKWLYTVHFIDALTGWAAGGEYNAPVLIKTTDGGNTWSPYASLPSYNQQSIALHSVHFTDTAHGWAVGGMDLALHTTDGGATWLRLDWSWLKNFVQPLSVHFADANMGWVLGNAYLLQTTDSGNHWNIQMNENLGNSVHFSGLNHGWAAGRKGMLSHTTNSGTAWEEQTKAASFQNLNALFFADVNTGWAAGAEGTILKTTNSGLLWTAQVSGLDGFFNSLFFLDAKNGWAAGLFSDGLQDKGKIFKTTDGGTHWTEQAKFDQGTLESIRFVNSQVGWTVGESGTLRKTTNGGTTWTSQTHPFVGTTRRLESVYFTDLQNGWIAAGSDGKLLHTADGGTSWIEQNSGTSEWLYALLFINSTTGWSVGSSGIVLKTTDGGASWIKKVTGVTGSLEFVFFIDSNNGYAAGRSGKGGLILHTTDGGNIWYQEESNTANDLAAIFFADKNHGWTAGKSGTILAWNAGGTENRPPVFTSRDTVMAVRNTAFEYIPLAVDPEGSAVQYTFSDYPAWLAPGTARISGTPPSDASSTTFTVMASDDGAQKSILKVIVLIGSVTDIEKSSMNMPKKLSLYPNYPNPFNSGTEIRFDIPEAYNAIETSLDIINLRGETIRTLIHKKQNSGQYRAVWDGKGENGTFAPSGIYLCRLQTASSVIIQKITLVR